MMKCSNICRIALIFSGLIFTSLAFSYNVKVGSLLFSRKDGQWYVQADENESTDALAAAVGSNPSPVVFASSAMIILFQDTKDTGDIAAVVFWVAPHPEGEGIVGSNLNTNALAEHMDSYATLPESGNSGGFPAFSLLNAMTSAVLFDADLIAGGWNINSTYPIPAALTLGGTQSPVGGGHAVSLTGEDNELTVNHHTDNRDDVPNHLPTVTVYGITSAQLEQKRTLLTTLDEEGEQDENKGGNENEDVGCWQRFIGYLSGTGFGQWLGASKPTGQSGDKVKQEAISHLACLKDGQTDRQGYAELIMMNYLYAFFRQMK